MTPIESTICQDVTTDSAPPSEQIRTHLDELGIPLDYGFLRSLPEHPEAGELVTARVLRDGRELKLTPEAADAWTAMQSAAKADGIELILISGFRSVAHQRAIIDRKIASGELLETILKVNAAPGFSEHHTGRAVDIGTPGCPPLSEDFEQTEAYRWITCKGPRLGFRLSYPRNNPHGLIYEPWHWCFDSLQLG